MRTLITPLAEVRSEYRKYELELPNKFPIKSIVQFIDYSNCPLGVESLQKLMLCGQVSISRKDEKADFIYLKAPLYTIPVSSLSYPSDSLRLVHPVGGLPAIKFCVGLEMFDSEKEKWEDFSGVIKWAVRVFDSVI